MEKTLEHFPEFARAKALTAVLEPGDMLYLPSLWWHEVKSEVEQGTSPDSHDQHTDVSGGVNIAVNFWYKSHSQALLNVYEALRWQMS